MSTSNRTRLGTTPTVVIALGDSGIRDARKIHEKAEAEGVADQLLVIWINSRSEFPENTAPGVKTFRLKKPDKQHIQRDQSARSYVSSEREIKETMGAKRWREIARYYIDTPENISRLEDFLRTRIERFITGFLQDNSINGPDGANIILTAGAGGGTGSGALPLVTAMADTVTDEMSTGGELSSVNFHLWGIVSVATVHNTKSRGPVPDVKPRYLSNSATLLSELRAMAGEGDPSFPLEIPLVAAEEGANIRRDSYTIDDNPFDGVYLIRYVQDEIDDVDAYRRQINHTAATVAFRWMRQDFENAAVENAADDLDDTFFEVRAITFQAPTDTLTKLFETEERLEAFDDELADLRAERERLTEGATQIGALQSLMDQGPLSGNEDGLDLGIDTSIEVELEADGGIPEPTRRTRNLALKTANSIDPSQASRDLIEDRIQTLQIQLADRFHEEVPAEALISVVGVRTVLTQLVETRDAHAFPEQVRDFVDSNIDALEEFNGAFDESAPAQVQYTEIVRPFLKNRLSSLRTEFNQTTPILDHSKRSQLSARIESVEQQLERLDRLHSEHSRLMETIEECQKLLQTKRERLVSKLTGLQERFEDLENRIDGLLEQQQAAQMRREQLRSELLTPSMGRMVTLPVIDPNRIDPALFDESPDLSTLIKEGIIDSEQAASAINTALRTEEGNAPLDDTLMTESGARSPVKGRPIVFGADETIELLWAEGEASDKVTDVVTSEFHFDHKRISERTDDALTILVEYGNLHFENFLHPVGAEQVAAGQMSLVGLDIDLAASVAYPELLGLEPQLDTTQE